jgi:hypothetical protein
MNTGITTRDQVCHFDHIGQAVQFEFVWLYISVDEAKLAMPLKLAVTYKNGYTKTFRTQRLPFQA